MKFLRQFIYQKITTLAIPRATERPTAREAALAEHGCRPIQSILRTSASSAAMVAAVLMTCVGGRPALAQTSVAYTYRNLPVGALGSNFGGVVHPKNGNVVYFRGDGGSYRWDATNTRWISISDSTPIAKAQDDVTYYGGGGASALAIDPNETAANVVYMASINEIWKSTNRGTTWVATGLRKADSSLIDTVDNGNGRWQGERLLVDPNNSSVIYYASNNDGLWKNTTAGASGWTQLSGFPWRGERDFGVCFVAFDRSGGTVSVNGQTVSARIYAGVCVINSGGSDGGVYRSTDGGQSWAKVGGTSPGALDWGQTAPNGTLYVTHSNGVSKIPAGQSDLVACASPWAAEPGRGHGPLAVAQSDASGNTLFVSINAYGTAPNITVQNNRWNHNPISRSTDGGQTWSNISQVGTWNVATSNLTYTPDQFAHQVNWLAVNPTNANDLWMGDDTQVYHTDNAGASNAASVAWTNPIAGFEGGTFNGKAMCPPSGAPVFGHDQDIGLFRFRDVNQYPVASDLMRNWADASGADFCETDSNFIAYAGTNGASTYITEGGVAVTTNNGNSWTVVVGGTQFGQHDPIYHGGRIAVGATKQSNGYPVIVHYPEGTGSPRYSTNWGTNWANVSGLPGQQINWYYATQNLLAADRVNGNKLYFLEGSWGGTNRLYYSTNGGQSFTVNWSLPLTYSHGLYGDIMAVPGREGEVLFNQVDYNSFSNAGDEGFYRATRADTAAPIVTKVVGISKVYSFSVGKAAPGFSTSALYIFARTNFSGTNRVGIFRSDDALAVGKSADMSDATWVQVYNPDTDTSGYGVLMRGKTTLQADRQNYGRFYISTGGRGFWRGDASTSNLPVVATPTSSPGGGNYTSAQSVTLSVATSGATIRYTTNGTTPTAGSTAYSSPISVSSTTTIKAIGMKSGSSDSAVATALYTITTGGPAGTGTGLAASYFNNTTLTGTAALTRTEAVDFDWSNGSPGTPITVDNFSARWTGQVEAPVTGSYTFTVTSDDGVRLWVGATTGTAVIDKWIPQGPTSYSYVTSLTAGQKYDVKMEYYESGGGAVARLRWSYPGQGEQAIPASRLYSATPVTGLLPDGTYKVISRHSGKSMEVSANGTANGSNVQQGSYNAGANQKWTITHLGNNQYKVIGLQSGRALDVSGVSTADGANVHIWDYVGGNNQKWTLAATSGGYYSVIAVHSGKALDVAGVSTGDGANIHQWTYGAANNQQWAFQAP